MKTFALTALCLLAITGCSGEPSAETEDDLVSGPPVCSRSEAAQRYILSWVNSARGRAGERDLSDCSDISSAEIQKANRMSNEIHLEIRGSEALKDGDFSDVVLRVVKLGIGERTLAAKNVFSKRFAKDGWVEVTDVIQSDPKRSFSWIARELKPSNLPYLSTHLTYAATTQARLSDFRDLQDLKSMTIEVSGGEWVEGCSSCKPFEMVTLEKAKLSTTFAKGKFERLSVSTSHAIPAEFLKGAIVENVLSINATDVTIGAGTFEDFTAGVFILQADTLKPGAIQRLQTSAKKQVDGTTHEGFLFANHLEGSGSSPFVADVKFSKVWVAVEAQTKAPLFRNVDADTLILDGRDGVRSASGVSVASLDTLQIEGSPEFADSVLAGNPGGNALRLWGDATQSRAYAGRTLKELELVLFKSSAVPADVVASVHADKITVYRVTDRGPAPRQCNTLQNRAELCAGANRSRLFATDCEDRLAPMCQ